MKSNHPDLIPIPTVKIMLKLDSIKKKEEKETLFCEKDLRPYASPNDIMSTSVNIYLPYVYILHSLMLYNEGFLSLLLCEHE